MANKLLMSLRFSLLQRQLHTVHGLLRATPAHPRIPCSHGQSARSHSATILHSANHECEHGHERRPSAIACCTETTMSSLVDALADKIKEDQSAPNDQAMSLVFKRAGARSLRGGSTARSVSGERHAIAARTHQMRPMIRSTLMAQF